MRSKGVKKINEIADRATRTQIKDKSRVVQYARIEALELDNLIEAGARFDGPPRRRGRSRAARTTAPTTTSATTPNWLKHTLWYKDGDRLEYKPVHMKPLTARTIEPKGTDLLTHPNWGKHALQDFPLRPGQGRKARDADYDVVLDRTTACSSMPWCASRSRTTA